jgi:hypothetical protein
MVIFTYRYLPREEEDEEEEEEEEDIITCDIMLV